MNTPSLCTVDTCIQAAAASLDGKSLCRPHFISECYDRLDRYEEIRHGVGFSISEGESVRRFIQQCTRWADEIDHRSPDLDNLERAKLLNIILSATELGRHLRRSPRKAAAIPVHLVSDRIGGAWEEDTETLLVSRHGALVRCKHVPKAGETIHFTRADTGEQALVRVAWQRPSNGEEARIGVEFVGCENFWGLDWGVVEEAREAR